MRAGKKSDFEKISAQHRELGRTCRSLRTYLDRPRPAMGDREVQAWAAELGARITALHDDLSRHFQEEEDSGFLEELTREHPRASRTVEDLRSTHAWILSELLAIRQAAASYADGIEPADRRLRVRTASVLDRLVQHEQDERSLLHGLYAEDLGGGD